MKLVIDGVEYSAVNHHGAPPLHMIELQQQSKSLIEGGLGMSRIERIGRDAARYQREHAAWRERLEAGDATEDDAPLSPDDAHISIAVVVFLTLRGAGQRITFADAAEISPERMVWRSEPDDAPTPGGEPDPTTPGLGTPVTPGVDPDPEAPTATASTGHSRTSPSQSPTG